MGGGGIQWPPTSVHVIVFKLTRLQEFYFFNLSCRVKIPPSKFEVNLTLHLSHFYIPYLHQRHLGLNNYFHAYAIIDFLTNRSAFPNTVTYIEHSVFVLIFI